jgi:hypothetical protein
MEAHATADWLCTCLRDIDSLPATTRKILIRRRYALRLRLGIYTAGSGRLRVYSPVGAPFRHRYNSEECLVRSVQYSRIETAVQH